MAQLLGITVVFFSFAVPYGALGDNAPPSPALLTCYTPTLDAVVQIRLAPSQGPLGLAVEVREKGLPDLKSFHSPLVRATALAGVFPIATESYSLLNSGKVNARFSWDYGYVSHPMGFRSESVSGEIGYLKPPPQSIDDQGPQGSPIHEAFFTVVHTFQPLWNQGAQRTLLAIKKYACVVGEAQLPRERG